MLSINAFLLRTQELTSTAIQSNSIHMNYEQLGEAVFKVMGFLKNSGIKEGENVAIIGNNDSELIISVLALWQIKAVPVLINPRLAENEIKEQIITADCNSILVSKNIDSSSLNLNRNVILFPSDIDNIADDQNVIEELDPENTAVIIFTAGTSGNAKGVELSFNNLMQSAKIGDQVIHHSNNDKWLLSLPIFHVGGFSIITRALLFGTTIIIPADLQTDSLSTAMNNFKPTLCSFVPTQLFRLLETETNPNDELRSVLLGGGYIDQKLITDSIYSGWHITKVYGATETGSFVTALSGEELFDKPKSAGKAVKPNQIVIVNENRIQIPWGEVGEIAVYSPAVMKGYYQNKEETGNKFKDDFYMTADIGFLDEDGYLFIESRKSDLIVTGGENVFPFEVENRITEHQDILDAAVFPLKDDDWGEIVAAAVVLQDPEKTIALEDFEEFLKKDLAGFKVPKKLFFEESLPRNELGKIVRSKLTEKYQEI
jgi:O-succinylbenzoic acid--CoA ligase